MLLYRYLSLEHAIQCLEERRLKVGRLNELNDPFDCFPRVVNLPSEAKGFDLGFADGMLSSRSEKFGLVCYSGTVNDPVLWSHYSNGHRGVALGFEVPTSDTLVKVTYSDERPTLDFHSFNVSTPNEAAGFAKSVMTQIFSVKASSWSYEEEYRQFFLLESCIAAKGMYFIDLPALKRIVIGARCNMAQSYFNHFVQRSGWEGVVVLKAMRSATSYKIEA
jgi:Protein of unknown function (DUF2971)